MLHHHDAASHSFSQNMVHLFLTLPGDAGADRCQVHVHRKTFLQIYTMPHLPAEKRMGYLQFCSSQEMRERTDAKCTSIIHIFFELAWLSDRTKMGYLQFRSSQEMQELTDAKCTSIEHYFFKSAWRRISQLGWKWGTSNFIPPRRCGSSQMPSAPQSYILLLQISTMLHLSTRTKWGTSNFVLTNLTNTL